MKKWVRALMRLPIRWKLTVWSALMITVAILSYNLVQFFVLNHWLQQYDVQSIQSSMGDVLGYYQTEKRTVWTSKAIQASQGFIETAVEKNEMIRILDDRGVPLLTVSHGLPDHWVKPQGVKEQQITSFRHKDERILIERAPLMTAQFTGTVEIARSSENIDTLTQLILTLVVSGGIGAIFLAAFGGYFLSRKMLEPVKTLTDTMRTIRGGGLDERVIVLQNGDEFSTLSTLFNDMMDQVEKSFLQQKQFIEDASHELRTPIAVLEGHLSLLKRWGKNDPAILDESLDAITQETKRLQGLVKELLALTRAETFQTDSQTETEVRSVLQHVVSNMEVLYPEFQFGLVMTAEVETLGIPVKAEHLEQILFIILDNAIKYSSQTKRVDISACQTKNECLIRVADYGEGIPAKDLPYIFDRFYRVDKARSRKVGGNGLGLSIAQRLMSAYQGEIRVESEEGVGTKMELRFPL